MHTPGMFLPLWIGLLLWFEIEAYRYHLFPSISMFIWYVEDFLMRNVHWTAALGFDAVLSFGACGLLWHLIQGGGPPIHYFWTRSIVMGIAGVAGCAACHYFLKSSGNGMERP